MSLHSQDKKPSDSFGLVLRTKTWLVFTGIRGILLWLMEVKRSGCTSWLSFTSRIKMSTRGVKLRSAEADRAFKDITPFHRHVNERWMRGG